MNFVNQLEDHLRDLGAEARKKHPGVYSSHCICQNAFQIYVLRSSVNQSIFLFFFFALLDKPVIHRLQSLFRCLLVCRRTVFIKCVHRSIVS